MTRYDFAGDVQGLEIARGHDGFLRGDPEPVMLAATYVIDGAAAYLVGRTLHRFRAHGPFPSLAIAEHTPLPSGSVSVDHGLEPKWVVLAVALEEDGGEDVQRLFGALERARSLAVWAPDGGDLEPLALAAVPETVEWSSPRDVHVLVEAVPAKDTCKSDKWIGAVAFWVRPVKSTRRYRMPFLSEDRRNDWTALVDLRC